ncbi:hypothetical protein ACN6LM_004508 [Streptomyces sp. SAS_281]|uniref:hypothetical protein n=1 Tax=Streptomyces sp. SAS_281 TaxID=3412744 RepID=UPI00403CA01C
MATASGERGAARPRTAAEADGFVDGEGFPDRCSAGSSLRRVCGGIRCLGSSTGSGVPEYGSENRIGAVVSHRVPEGLPYDWAGCWLDDWAGH